MKLVDSILAKLGYNQDSSTRDDYAKEHKWPSEQSSEDHKDDRPQLQSESDKIDENKENGNDGNNLLYVTLDGDDVGDVVEKSFMANQTKPAKELSEAIRHSHELIRKEVEALGGEVLVDGGDNMIFWLKNGR